MIRILTSIIINIILCIIYSFCVECFNCYKPIVYWAISLGITFRLSIIILFITLFFEMLIDLYLKNKIIKWIPIIFPLFYWASYYRVFPYRFIAFIALNITIYFIYTFVLIFIRKYAERNRLDENNS